VWALTRRGLEVGPHVCIGRGCRLILERDATLVLGERCSIDDATTIAVYGSGRIVVGGRAFVGHHSTIAAHESVEIGAGTYLAELVSVRDHDHTVGSPPSGGSVDVEPVTIGCDVWIGAKATVLRGAHIGDGTVIGANAVVRGHIPARMVAAGVPAKVIRSVEEAAL